MALSKSNQLINEDVIVKRIKVIRGHLAGVENMLISQKPHQDILTQLSYSFSSPQGYYIRITEIYQIGDEYII